MHLHVGLLPVATVCPGCFPNALGARIRLRGLGCSLGIDPWRDPARAKTPFEYGVCRAELQGHTGRLSCVETTDERVVDAELVAGENRLLVSQLGPKLNPSGTGSLGRIEQRPIGISFERIDLFVQCLRYLPVFEVQLETEPHGARRIVRVDEVAESAQVDPVATEIGLVNVDVAMAQDFVRVAEGRIPDFPVTRSHPPASWPSAANSSICRTYRKTAGEESRRRSPVANRWMRP